MKERVDVLLVQQGYFPTREKAKAAIMAGIVYSGTERIDKAGTKVDIAHELHVKGNVHPYVGRGGLKLEKAIDTFQLHVEDVIMIDIGASTGGFTDCALQKGARHVYAVDVGYGQLDWKLRNDERVTVLERTNFRYLQLEQLSNGLPDFATIDVSFISLQLIFPKLAEILVDGGQIVTLIKPQFEAGKESVGKKGIVRDKDVHKQVIYKVVEAAAGHKMKLCDITHSPITGGDGNIEFLAHFIYQPSVEDTENAAQNDEAYSQNGRLIKPSGATFIQDEERFRQRIEEVVETAHKSFS